jgi:hypothetical protein
MKACGWVEVGRQIFESKLEGRRRRGRPGVRWLEDVETVYAGNEG